MSNPKQNWNDMSGSDSEDSWFDDEPEDKVPKSEPKNEEGGQSQPKVEKQEGQAESKKGKEEDSAVKVEQKKKFLTDQQLLIQYREKKVDDTKAIKVVGCHNQDAKQMIKDMESARVRVFNDTTFFLFFKTEEALLQFIQQKIDNRYKFYLHSYGRRKPREDEPKPEERRKRGSDVKVRDEHDDRGNYKNSRKREKGERREKEEGRRGDKEEYRRREDREEGRRRDTRDEPRRKEGRQDKGRKEYVQKKPFEMRDNKIEILSNNVEVSKVMEEINHSRLLQKWNKVIIKASSKTFRKVSDLCRQLAKAKYFLEVLPKVEAGKEDEVHDLLLIENGRNQTNKFYEQCNPKVEEVKQVPKRLLGSKHQQYFKDIKKYNLSQIVEGFDEHQYIKKLKEANDQIQKYWNSWKVEAEDDHIQMLLRLTNRLKKSTIYDVQLHPSLRGERAVLMAELKEKPENQRRPKVNVAPIQQYLN